MNVTLTLCEGVVPRCAICHDDVLDGAVLCAGCRTLVHVECRGERCPTLGCTQRKAVALPAVTTIPFFERQILPGIAGWRVLVSAIVLLFAHVTVGVMGQGHTARVERMKADMRAIGDALEAPPLDPWGNESVLVHAAGASTRSSATALTDSLAARTRRRIYRPGRSSTIP